MNRKLTLASIVLCLISASASAQGFSENFLLEGVRTSFRFNPAATGSDPFLSLGSYAGTSAANIGASSILFPDAVEGSVVTGLHSAVPADTFLGGLKDNNILTGNMDYNLFAYGFSHGGHFHIVEVSLKNDYRTALSKDLFSLLKIGSRTEAYDLGGTMASDRLYAEIAYGCSKKLGDRLTIGARGKLLVGLAAASYSVSSLDVTLGEDRLEASGGTQLLLTDRSFKFNPDEDGTVGIRDIRRKQTSYIPTGLGLAVDLGVLFTPFEDLTVSASILDLGGILWRYGNAAASSGSVVHEGFGEFDIEDFDTELLSDKISALADNVMSIVELKKKGAKLALCAVPLKINVGVKYRMPFYDALTVGLTGNFESCQGLPYVEARLGAGVTPLEWLSATANVGCGTFGAVWGAGLSAKIFRFRINASYEYNFGGVVPVYGYSLTPCRKHLSAGLTFDL